MKIQCVQTLFVAMNTYFVNEKLKCKEPMNFKQILCFFIAEKIDSTIERGNVN